MSRFLGLRFVGMGAQVAAARDRGWITAQQYTEIMEGSQ